MVNNLSSLVSLTELNLRRNNIGSVTGLNQLPALQRVFLSHNSISRLEDIACLFEINYLIELSLDGNPLSEGAGTVEEGKGEGKGRASSSSSLYRSQLVAGMPGLRHLDLKRVTEEERAAAVALLGGGASALGGGRTGATSASAAGNSITHSGDASIDGRVSAGLSDYGALCVVCLIKPIDVADV